MLNLLSKNKCIMILSIVIVLTLIYLLIILPIQEEKRLEKPRIIFEEYNNGFLNDLLEDLSDDYFSITGEKMIFDSLAESVTITKENCKNLTKDVLPNEPNMSIINFCFHASLLDLWYNNYKNQKLQETKLKTDEKLVNFLSEIYTQRMLAGVTVVKFYQNEDFLEPLFNVENISEYEREKIMEEVYLRFKDNLSAEKNALIQLKNETSQMQFEEVSFYHMIDGNEEVEVINSMIMSEYKKQINLSDQINVTIKCVKEDIDDLADYVINQDQDNYILYSTEIQVIYFIYERIQECKR